MITIWTVEMANGYGYSGGPGGIAKFDPVERAKLVESVSDRNRDARMERISEIEDKVFDVSAQVIMAHLAFTEVDHDQEHPPEEWVQQFGEVAARRRMIVAKAGYLPASQMPSAVKLSQMVWQAISRANSHRQRGQVMNQVNVKIALPAPTSQEHPGETVYEVKDLDD